MSLRDRISRIGSFLVSIVLRRPGDVLASGLSFLGLRRKFVQQSPLLILTDINPDKEGDLRNKLDNIRSRLIHSQKHNLKISFYSTETVHYAAWMILPGVKSEDGKSDGPAKLAFETNYDGSLEMHLKDLVDHCRQELDEVYDFSRIIRLGHPMISLL